MANNRGTELTGIGLRPVQAVLEENREAFEPIREQAAARLTARGQEEMIGKVQRAYAAGEPGLLDQARPNYITEEALVRAFATGFGQIEMGGDTDQVPEFTTLEPDSVKVYTVAVTRGAGGARRRNIYRVVETQTTGMWKEIQTDPVEIPWVNPFFQRKRAILDAQANDKIAYALQKEIDNIAFTALENQIKTTFAAADKVWTFKDADVKGLPTGNSKTSTANFWNTLRDNVIPYYLGVGKADRVINVHILHTDLQFLYKPAALDSTLGGYSDFQREIYEGNVQDVTLFGHRFRIIPENWKIGSGEMFCAAGAAFKMWLPPSGSVAHRITRDDGSSVITLHRVYEILAPSNWMTNVLKSTWSTSA